MAGDLSAWSVRGGIRKKEMQQFTIDHGEGVTSEHPVYDFSLLYQPEDVSVGIPQDTQEWLDARRGRITASKRAHAILHSREETIGRMMDEMATELHFPAEDGYSGKATEHGHAFEDQAINEYDMARLTAGVITKTPGMFVHPKHDIASATPDFFEGQDTTGQIKCPYKLKNHLNLLHFGVRMVNLGYYTQVQFESFITSRPNIVFVSYHPDAPATNQVYIETIPRDEYMHEKFDTMLTRVHHDLVNNIRPKKKITKAGVDGIPSLF
jgi:hypothetical protein